MDDFSTEAALIEAASLPDAELFVLAGDGDAVNVFVLAPDRFLWHVLTPEAAEFLAMLDPRPGGYVELEHRLAMYCEWVPRSLRPLALGLVDPAELDMPRH